MDDSEEMSGAAESEIAPAGTNDTHWAGPIDLSPMVFDSIEKDDRRLLIEPPLSLDTTMDDESGQL